MTLNELYQNCGLSKLQLARAMGISASTLYRIEAGTFDQRKGQDIIDSYVKRCNTPKPSTDHGLHGNALVRAMAKVEMAYATLGNVLEDLRKSA